MSNVYTEQYSLCDYVARNVYRTTPPTTEYAHNVAKLLFMIAVHESGGFRWRRQIGFTPDSMRGGFGITQLEIPTIRTTITWLLLPHNKRLAERLNIVAGMDVFKLRLRGIAMLLQTPTGDTLAYALSRCHLYTIPEAVPSDEMELAQYAKRYWNTYLGKATAEQYYRSFKKYYALRSSPWD